MKYEHSKLDILNQQNYYAPWIEMVPMNEIAALSEKYSQDHQIYRMLLESYLSIFISTEKKALQW